VGGARLYRSQTARVNAPVRPLIASGPQFLHVRDAGPGRVRFGFGPFRGLCRPTVRQKAAAALDKVAVEIVSRDREIERLQALLDQANPPKCRKVSQNPNERFVNLVEILAQANQEPVQRIRKKKIVTPEAIVGSEGDSSELEDLEPVRRTGHDRKPTRRYMERDNVDSD
jgi:hypothetical protein